MRVRADKVGGWKIFLDILAPYWNSERMVVLLCDCNCVSTSHDKISATLLRDARTETVLSILNECVLDDVGEAVSREGVRFTHFQECSHTRLDLAQVSIKIMAGYIDYHVRRVPFSDRWLVAFS